MGCAVALKILEVIQRDHLADNARAIGEFVKTQLEMLVQKYPAVLKNVRGFGLMIGLELQPDAPSFKHEDKTPALQFVNRLHAAGVLTIPAATAVIRILPPLNLSRGEAEEGLRTIGAVAAAFA